MKRALIELTRNVYDLLIIGGGIYGAWVARDAALRGLSVVLVEKSDFAAATSANSQKIVHGGFRYLQHADVKRMRQSLCERSTLMRIAPHLVHPLPVLIPTFGHGMRGKEVLALALMVNDLVGVDRNYLLDDSQKHIPRGYVISREEVLQLLPGIYQQNLTGGAIFYDAQVYNTERMLLSILRSAEKSGATLANYVEVTGFLQSGNRVIGVKARDVFTGEVLDIQAKIVVNAAGPWVDDVLQLLDGDYQNRKVLLSKAISIVVKHQLIPKYAVGVSSPFRFQDDDTILDKGFRFLFIAPWRSYSLIGTAHTPYYGNPNDFSITEKDIQSFIDEVNKVYPASSLKWKDVSFFNGGLLPMDGSSNSGVRLTKKYRIWDHMQDQGVEGLISVVGVKYTTARNVAEKTLNVVFSKLGKQSPRCLTAVTPVYGGHIGRFNDFLYLAQEIENKVWGLDTEVIRHLIYNYGSEYSQMFRYFEENPNWKQTVNNTSQVIKAEVVYGVREEMAQKLADVVFRRTELGAAGNPGETALKNCAAIMARELNWDQVRIQRELDEVRAVFSIVT